MPEAIKVSEKDLLAVVQRIEKLESEKQGISDDIKEVYAEAKAKGYDPTVIQKVIKIRKMDENKKAELEQVLQLYLTAVGETVSGKIAV